MKIGFIGLGAMGSGIAANILKAGHEVVAWNRSPGPVQALAKLGAKVADTPEVALQSDALFSMLASDAVMRDVGLDGALLERAPAGLLHVNMATVSVAFSRELAEVHARHDLHYIASPVFGRPDVAAAGTLTIIAAGPSEDIERVRPILEKLGARFAVVGEKPEQANLFKIAGNFMIASAIEAMGEAAALLRKGDVNAGGFFDVMTAGLFAAPAYKIYSKIIAEQSYVPAGFKLSLGYKDAGLTLAAARELETALPLASVVHDSYLEAMAAGWGEFDWSALAKLAAKRAGLND